MGKNQLEYGYYQKIIPYLKDWNSTCDRTIVVFPPTGELAQSLITNPEEQVKLYRKFIPANFTLYVLGFDRNLPPDHTTDKIADQFASIIREKIGPATIMAVSYGGFIGIPFAAKYPELVERLILMVTAYAGSLEGMELVKKMVHLVEKGEVYKVDQMFCDVYTNPLYKAVMKFLTFVNRKKTEDRNPPSTFINAYKHLLATLDYRKKYLTDIKAPTLIIGGTKDAFFSTERYQETAKYIPNAKLELFNSGHMVPIEKMKKVRQAVHEFLS